MDRCPSDAFSGQISEKEAQMFTSIRRPITAMSAITRDHGDLPRFSLETENHIRYSAVR